MKWKNETLGYNFVDNDYDMGDHSFDSWIQERYACFLNV